jgi:ATP-dependent Clp protease ATP-binding subunit ClpC
MPKINVYLPDELAEAVRIANVPVSAICQRALEQAVRRITAIRGTAVVDLAIDDPTSRLARHFTGRARSALRSAIDRARASEAPSVGTGDLLAGLLAEHGNLALRVLEAIDVAPEEVKRDLDGVSSVPEPSAAGSAAGPVAAGAGAVGSGAVGSGAVGTRASGETGEGLRFSGAAANALELAVTEAHTLGHNYVGCEHLLLGLIGEEEGAAGTVLRALGAELRLTRRAVVAALSGFVHLRAQYQSAPDGSSSPSPAVPSPVAPSPDPAGSPAGAAGGIDREAVMTALRSAVREELDPVLRRLERVEARLGT